MGLKELHPVRQKLKKQQARLIKEEAKLDLFEGDKRSKKQQKQITKAEKKIVKLEGELHELETATFYDQAFEWRFEFPEVLDEEGTFIGFDAVLANPPYIPLEQIPNVERDYYRSSFKVVERKFDTSILFFLRSFDIGRIGSNQIFIAPITWETGENYQKLRKALFDKISV